MTAPLHKFSPSAGLVALMNRIEEYVRDHRGCTSADIMAKFGTSQSQCLKALRYMRYTGRVRRVHEIRNAFGKFHPRWEIGAEQSQNDPATFNRRVVTTWTPNHCRDVLVSALFGLRGIDAGRMA